ncbi:uncharacterized protein HKW66_Vig0241070 [Vigna angularis]|uniref:Rab-GAP TBC domain-containing protein n=1 Tax=Phaseolus angularis TaxID=3914 RepID=A0A8T0JFK6_PHAAN|nr:uncharacterized protein HKW66_Vig0241070 [Vigna angularis]
MPLESLEQKVYPLHRLKDSQNSGKGKGLLRKAKRFKKFRERKGLIEKDVVRIDRSIPFYEGDDNPNVNILRDILLTYSFYNFDLGYCQTNTCPFEEQVSRERGTWIVVSVPMNRYEQ